MLRKRQNHYRRQPSLLFPVLTLLIISAMIAFGGAFYWDKLQQENIAEQEAELQNMEVEEIRLPSVEDDEPLPSDLPEEKPAEAPSQPTETPSEEAEEPAESEEPEQPKEQEEPLEEKPDEEEVAVRPNSNTSAIVPLGSEVDESYFADAAFIGDSLTQGLQLYDILDTNVVANKGINLQTIYNSDKIRVAEGYTSVFAELERIQPKKIYILLGTNDIAWRSEGDFVRLYGELIDNLRADHSDAELYIQSMFPVTSTYSNTDNGIDNQKLMTYNGLLMNLAAEKGCHYLDIHSALANENGTLPNEASPDGYHLNASHYKIWFNYLKNHVA